jgi:hypothetical protein
MNALFKQLWISIAILLIAGVCYAGGIPYTGDVGASDVTTDTTNFNSNLSSLDTDLQKCLETLDEILGGAASSMAFSGLTTQTNTAATMTVGTGATLTYSGTGIINATRFLGVTSVDATEFAYLNGVTSAIQTQLDAKQTSDGELSAIAGLTSAANKVPYFTGSGTAGLLDAGAKGKNILAIDTFAHLQSSMGVASSGANTDITSLGGITTPFTIAQGGTNSGTALTNNRVMVSSGGAIVVAPVITAARVLISDANGIPSSSSITSTTLVFLDATSSVQGQLDAKQGLDADLTALGGISGVRGDIIYYGASGWTRLAKSSNAGYILTQGANDPGWAAAGAGAGNVVGPTSDPGMLHHLATYGNTTGLLLENVYSLVTTVANPGLDTTIPTEAAVRAAISASGGGTFSGPGSSTDNAVVRFNGTGGATGQDSYMTVDDSGSVNIPTGQHYKINNTNITYTDVAALPSGSGVLTSAALATALSNETGSGVVVFNTSGTLITPNIGAATATSINKVAITAPATSATLTLANGSSLITVGAYATTLTASATTALTLPTAGTLATTSNLLSDFGNTTSAQLQGVITNETGGGGGAGYLVFSSSPALTTPDIGVATATSVNKVTITAPASSATLTLANGSSLITVGGYSTTLTASGTTAITLPTTGTLATTSNKLNAFAATSSAELAGNISDETGSGLLTFATSPVLTTPNIGVATATSVNKMSITAPTTSSTLAVADGKTFTVSNTLTLVGTDSTVMTFPTTTQTIPGLAQANTFTGNISLGDADTDTFTVRSMILGGNSREVQINAGTRTSPSHVSGTPTQDLYVAGNIETPNDLYVKTLTNSKTSGQSGVLLLYSKPGTSTLGTGFAGPITTPAASIYLRLPPDAPTNGYTLVAGSIDTDGYYPLSWSAPGGAVGFNAITAGNNNTGQSLQVGTTSTLTPTGSGIIAANRLGTVGTDMVTDSAGNNIFKIVPIASAVDYFSFTNAATAGTGIVTLAADGSDTNVRLALGGKGSGGIRLGDVSNNLLISSAGGMTMTGTGSITGGDDNLIAGGITFDSTPGAAGDMGYASNQFLFHTASLVPATSDGGALGSASLMWGDLFLASGGVINFNNGNVTLTHAAGVLTDNGNFAAQNLIQGYTTTATAAGSTTLTVASANQQYFTGSLAQTVVMPVATTLVNGQRWMIINNSSGTVTVQTSGGNTIQAMAANTQLLVACINTAGGTGTASWSWTYSYLNGNAAGLSAAALGTQNTWTGAQTFTSDDILIAGGITFDATPGVSGDLGYASNVFTLMAGATSETLTITGGSDSFTFASGTGATFTFTPNTTITGTLSAGAAGMTVDADGDTVAKTLTTTKSSGVAGTLKLYCTNGTDVTGPVLTGPATAAVDYNVIFPIAAAGGSGYLISVNAAGQLAYTPNFAYVSTTGGYDNTNHSYRGQTITVEAGETLAFGDLVYITNTVGAAPVVNKADADGAATCGSLLLIVDAAGIANNAVGNALVRGTAYHTDWTMTRGQVQYVGLTAGAIVNTTSGYANPDIIQKVGYALHPDILLFEPSIDYAVVAP